MKQIEFPIEKSQKLLLKTILCGKSDVRRHYAQWVDSVNYEKHIDGQSYALLPALYKKLLEIDCKDENMPRFSGVYKKSLYKNSLNINNFISLGRILNSQQISFTALKGIALVLNYHDDIGVRSMGDIDILVNKNDMPHVISLFGDSGFISDCGYDIMDNLNMGHSYSFHDKKGTEVDLHWQVLPLLFRDLPPCKTVFSSFQGIDFNILAPEDFIIHICLHGASWNPVTNIRWIYDLHTIISNDNIDWKYILNKMENTKYAYALFVMFSCFNRISSLKIPQEVVENLKEYENQRDNRKFAKKSILRPKSIIGILGWYRYSLHYNDKNIFEKLLRFPKCKLMTSDYDTYFEILSAYVKKHIFKISSN